MIETLTKAVPTAVAPMSQPITDALVIDCGDPAARVCTDLWADNTPGSVERIALRDFQSQGEAIAAVVFVGKPTLAASQRIRAALGNQSWSKLCFVVDCSAYFGSNAAVRAECELLEHFAAAKPGIIRTGFVEQCRTFRRRLAEWSLVGGQRATFVDAAELVACVRNELNHPESRTVALLGESRTWFQQAKSAGGATKVVGGLVRYSGLGLGVRAVTKTAGRFSKRWRKLDFSTIRPTSEEELLTLCGSHNFRHLAICGYNNGVNHFGWKNPGRTVVPTTETGRNIEVDGDTLIVDAGLTLKTCIDELAANDKEFYVVPNYSYIGIGTTFFVPVHGSGSEVSTMGDTIEWVRLFDPETQQIIEAERGDELFEESMYNMRSGLVLLQLRFRVRPRAEYFARKYEVESPTAEEVWSLFDDPETSNIEVRKNTAASDAIQVAKYYTSASDSGDRMSIARDSLGRVWDKLEENRVSAYLFHLFVRKMAFHVELFMTRDEFEIFWQHHTDLPLNKIQLRFARADGMKHSPFGHADCVSADLL